MAEFSDVGGRCSFEGCGRGEFLPFDCQACGGMFCKEHSSFTGHECPEADRFLRENPLLEEGEVAFTQKNCNIASTDTQAMVSSAARVLDSVARRFEEEPPPAAAAAAAAAAERGGGGGGGGGGVEHVRVAGARAAARARAAGDLAQDRFYVKAQHVASSSTNTKQKAISIKVQQMKIKSKSAGPAGVLNDNKFFVLVQLKTPDINWERHMYFPRLWTVGRAIDYVISFLSEEYRRAILGKALELYCERINSIVSKDTIIHGSKLEEFDTVILSFAGAFDLLLDGSCLDGEPDEKKQTSCAEHEGATRQSKMDKSIKADNGGEQTILASRDAKLNDEKCLISSSSGGPLSLQMNADNLIPPSSPAHESNPGTSSFTFYVKVGKEMYSVADLDENANTVLDLKVKLEQLTGIPVQQQKLLYKGILQDSQVICGTAVKDGAKVILMSKPK